MGDLHLDRLVALIDEAQRLFDHPVVAQTAETARAIDWHRIALAAPQRPERFALGNPDRVPQRDIQRRLSHHGDSHPALDECRHPHLLPQGCGVRGILADQERFQHLVDACLDRAHPARQRVQMTNTDRAVGFDLDDKNVHFFQSQKAGLWRIFEWHAQSMRTDIADFHLALPRRSVPAGSR